MASSEKDSTAAVYAKALYLAAGEVGVVERIENELRAMDEMVQSEVALRSFLQTPTIGLTDKIRVLKAALTNFHPLMLNFLSVGLQNRRVPGVLTQVISAYHELWMESQGIAEVQVRSARKLSASELESIGGAMQKRLGLKITILETVEPKLLGGLILRHGDTQWDISISQRLDALIQHLKDVKFGPAVLQMN